MSLLPCAALIGRGVSYAYLRRGGGVQAIVTLQKRVDIFHLRPYRRNSDTRHPLPFPTAESRFTNPSDSKLAYPPSSTYFRILNIKDPCEPHYTDSRLLYEVASIFSMVHALVGHTELVSRR